MYPEPCAECGGVEEHQRINIDLGVAASTTMACPAIMRGGGSRRDQCGSMSPYNHSHICRKAKGHHDYQPNDPEGFSVNYPPDPECMDTALPDPFTYKWAYDDAAKAATYEK